MIFNVLVGFNLAAAATVHTAPAAAARVLVSATTSTAGNLLLVCYLGGLVVAFVTMGVALPRGGCAALWLALLFSVASLLAAVGPPGLLGVVMAAPFIVVMFMLAGQIKSDARQEPAPSRSRWSTSAVPFPPS